MVQDNNLSSELRRRQDDYEKISVPHDQFIKYNKLGWDTDKAYKTRIRLRKVKDPEIAFEDGIWALFAKLGFSSLNKDRDLSIPHNDNFTAGQEVNILAIDDECILLVQSRCCTGDPQQGDFKATIQDIGGKKDGIIKTLKQLYPNSKHKIKFILATKNYYLPEQDTQLLANYDILHFDEETLEYYQDLSKYLGLAARYQLLGNIFSGQTIPELENKIPAIQGKMGGHTYYSFSVEPERLLKIAYVLHRNKANKKLMPTYQRLIKKSRLTAIQQFIENIGFFPNSLVINVETEKSLHFERANTQVESSISKIGILHLPKTYRSAYIIDSQHRLYGYANSDYRQTNSIPVVAFVNLNRTEQVRLFMQINENQKAVPKNLRNTLNADLLWNSSDLEERIKAIKLQVAQDLGEDIDSPLYDKIIIGENPKTSSRCITIDSVKTALDRSNFFGVINKNTIRKEGSFFIGDSEATYWKLLPFLKEAFRYFKDNLKNEWKAGENNEGILSINAGIISLIRIFSDVIDHLIAELKINPKTEPNEKVLEECKPYFIPLLDYYNNLSTEERLDLRKSYGDAGRAKYWRKLQQVISKAKNNFNPDGLSKYWEDEAKQYNEDSFKMIRDIETHLKSDFKQSLEDYYSANWFKKGVPPQVQDAAVLLANQKNRELDDNEQEIDQWDCMTIIDYRRIATYLSNWKDVFDKKYTKPGEEKMPGGKDEKTKWMQKLERIRNQNVHSYSVKKDEFEFLCEIHEWLIETE
ncbi:DGQHR domain-containing protein [Pedobacter jejuensis]|uniref:DGQHR domain-containing protein n=2 Tax=Pedobacter jejuensis TaxID=1268550 RepID=A0A3N0C1J1_9SPHI|nr:DGQHR domain-containing protein [Pedobacter jejuensis]